MTDRYHDDTRVSLISFNDTFFSNILPSTTHFIRS